jgi:ubiquitin C-terminal hydrolase
MYDLNSIVVHAGSASFGHYYCLVNKTCDENNDDEKKENLNNEKEKEKKKEWLMFNDHVVSKFNGEEALKIAIGNNRSTENAYMLFYVKKNIPP